MSKVSMGLLALASTLLGSGCAYQFHDPRIALTPDCTNLGNAHDCRITVDVTESIDKRTCKAKVISEQQEVKFLHGQTNKNIFWDIRGPDDYIFTRDGIAIEKNDPRDFDDPRRLANSRSFKWKNLHKLTTRKTYHYMVNVTNRDGTITCSQDPKIHNE